MSNPQNQSQDGATPMSVSMHKYRVTLVPVGCTDWTAGETLDIYVSDPPPQTVTFNEGDICDGTTAVLIS